MKGDYCKPNNHFGIVLLLLIMLCGCSDYGNIYSDKAFSSTGIQEDIPNAVEVYITAISSPSEAKWSDAKEVISSRMRIFAGEFGCFIEDRGDVLYIAADKDMFVSADTNTIMKYFIINPVRVGLYLPDLSEIEYLDDEDIVSADLEVSQKSEESRIQITLDPDTVVRLNDVLEKETLEFAFSIGNICYDVPIERDEKNDCVLYLKNESDERFLALQYYDITNPMPYVDTALHIYPNVTWEEPKSSSTSGQLSRSKLVEPVTEVVFSYWSNGLSEDKYDDLLSVLKKRLDALDCEYAVGRCYEDDQVIIAFGKDCPDNYTLQILGSNAVVSSLLNYEKTAYEKLPAAENSETNERYISIAEDKTSGRPVVDFSDYSKEMLYDLTTEAVQSKEAISILVNDYPLGYCKPENVVSDGRLVLDEVLPECDFRDCSSLISLIVCNQDDSEMSSLSIPRELSINDQYICNGSLKREPLQKWSYFATMSDGMMKTLSADVPRLFRISASNRIGFYLKAHQGNTLVQDFIRDINKILEYYPCSKCPFKEMFFCLCDEEETQLCRVFLSAWSFSDVHISMVNYYVEEMDVFSEELEHVCDEGIIHYD